MKSIMFIMLFTFYAGAYADNIVRLVHPVLGTDYYAMEFSKSDPKHRGAIALNKDEALKLIKKCGTTNLVEGKDYLLNSGTLLDMSLPGLNGNWYYDIESGPSCP